MDDDGGMMLNILPAAKSGVQSSRESNTSEKKFKGSWKQKMIQKKKEKAFNKKVFDTRPSGQTKPDKPAKKLDHNKNKTDAGRTESIKKTEPKFKARDEPAHSGKKFQVISTLFRHNPEIPELPEIKETAPSKKPQHLFSGESFGDLNLAPFMVSNLENNMKLTKMTSVQRLAIPSLLEGRDAFVKSQTGTGKTLCYAVPLVQVLQAIDPKIQRADGPYALILVPTRELALQSFAVLQKLLKPFNWIVPGCFTGGEKRKAEKARFRKGVNIIVATPGRLLDHIQQTQCLEFSHIRWLVLDEADRLLDMGFEKDITAILTAVSKQGTQEQQTVLLSATLTSEVKRLAGVSLKNPLFLDATQENESSETTQETKDQNKESEIDEEKAQSYSTPTQLKQFFVVAPGKLRLVTLAAFILWKAKSSPDCKMIIFVASRDSVEFHHGLFLHTLAPELALEEKQSLNLFKLHGSMSQTDRTKVFSDFSQAERGVLFCTDVAARGLDLPHVNWIVQYNTPGGTEDYVHRVGRTARIGSQGQGLLFLQPAEVGYLKALQNQGLNLKELKMNQMLVTLLDDASQIKGKGKKEHLAQKAATELQLKFEDHILSNEDHVKLAKAAFQSFIRAYATYPSSLKNIFHVKNLHLGHVAKSFALRKTPSELGHGKDKTKKKSIQKPIIKKKRKANDEFTMLRGPLAKKVKHKR